MMDYAALVEVTAPATEPIATADAKQHLRVDLSDDDAYIDGLVVVARRMAERIGLHALITQTLAIVLDDWPDDDEIVLPKPPLQAVNSVEYTDENGATSTLSSSRYIVDTDSAPGRLVLKRDESWPSDILQSAAGIRVEYDAGFGDAASDVPEDILQAMKLMVGHWYEHREEVSEIRLYDVPFAAEALLNDYRNRARRF